MLSISDRTITLYLRYPNLDIYSITDIGHILFMNIANY